MADHQGNEGLYEKIYSQDTNLEGLPHGWIQWKGTDVCMDIHCACGYHGHFDGDFFYYYECPICHACYAVGQVVKLIPLDKETTDRVIKFRGGPDVFKSDEPDPEDLEDFEEDGAGE